MMDDELLSAYVDGELSQPELAAVEARLRDDPQARKLVEQLRAVSATLRALPKHKIGVDLREVVLDQELVHSRSLLDDEDEGSDRRWVWAVMAIAAAFFLAVYMPKTERGNQKVAQADGQGRRAVQAAPHLVGPAERPRKPLELIAEGVLAPNLSNDIRADGGIAVEGDQLAMNEGLASRRQIAAAETRAGLTDEQASTEAYEVHLTPAPGAASTAKFDDLLARHGIVMRNDAADDQRQDEAQDVPQSEPELVLVEAPLKDIQQVIAACSKDDSAWKAQRVVGRKDSVVEFEVQADAVAKAEAAAPTAPRGWATHLGRGIAAPEVISIDGQPDVSSAKIRVLFILHPTAE